jgi:hypothetical protein
MRLSILLFSVVGVLGIATMARSQKGANLRMSSSFGQLRQSQDNLNNKMTRRKWTC